MDSTAGFLTFIPTDPRSKAAQEAIRVHVLRRRHRQRRESRQPRRHESPNACPHGGQFQILQFDPGSQQGASELPSPDAMSQESVTDPGERPHFLVQDEGIDCISPSTVSQCADLETSIERDLPLDRQSIEDILTQYFLLSGAGSPVAHEFLQTYRKSTATFNAFLAMVATRLSDEQGLRPLLDPAELEIKALRELSMDISQSPTAPSSSTICWTVALLAHLREGQHLNCHWNALLKMVRLQGGLYELRKNTDLYAFLFWAEGVAMHNCPESLGDLAPLREANENDSMRSLPEFLGRINARLAEHTEQAGSGSVPLSKLTSPILFSLQQPAIRKVKYIYDKWCRARLVCLIYLAALSLQGGEGRLQDSPKYQAVEHEVLRRERNYTVYPEELYYILILVGNQDNCELTWSVARLMNAVKELDQRDRNTCYRLLALYLGFQDAHAVAMVSSESRELSDRLVPMPLGPPT